MMGVQDFPQDSCRIFVILKAGTHQEGQMCRLTTRIALILMALALLPGTALSKKPESPGNSGKQKPSREHSVDRPAKKGEETNYFTLDRRRRVKEHYSRDWKASGCPPGLAKKRNGCLPPGQAKKRWRLGEPLPADVIYHEPPRSLLEHLGHTPSGQKLVRVGTDLLLIAIGTGIVIDAIEDLDRAP
jgi:Ni/Co efflux regulator RcnB